MVTRAWLFLLENNTHTNFRSKIGRERTGIIPTLSGVVIGNRNIDDEPLMCGCPIAQHDPCGYFNNGNCEWFDRKDSGVNKLG